MKHSISFLCSLLFPKTCISCHREGAHICEDCLSFLTPNQWTYPLPSSSHLSGLFSAVSYEDSLAQLLIRQLKYPPFLKDLSRQCAFLICAHIALARPKQDFSHFLIIPIPLHKRRLKWRGYNHAQELATQLGQAFALPVVTDVLKRTKHTTPQANLGREKRLTNMKGAFQVQNPRAVAEKNILLVDDVHTTGATMDECALVLKKAGANQIFGAVVARG